MPPKNTRRLTWCALALAGIALLGVKGRVERRLERPEAAVVLKRQRAELHAQSLRRLQTGFGTSLAGLLWIRFLQAHSHEPIPDGELSWEFVQLDTVTSLDPRFDRAYDYGSILLSILRQDKLGARLILERWVKRRPNRWRPRYLLGFHLFSELGLYAEASEQILRAAELPGAPFWLSALGVRLLSEAGALRQALQLTVELYASTNDPRKHDRLMRRVRSLNYAIQKSEWEQAAARFLRRAGRAPASLSDLERVARREPSALEPSAVPEPVARALEERFPFRWDSARKTVMPMRDPREWGLEPVGIFRPGRSERGS